MVAHNQDPLETPREIVIGDEQAKEMGKQKALVESLKRQVKAMKGEEITVSRDFKIQTVL